jgi:negative regulator of sigma E activity
MKQWLSEVLTHPLGLVGLALYLLVVGLVWRFSTRFRWLVPVAAVVLLAVVFVVIWLWRPQAESSQTQDPVVIQQRTEGAQSPAVGGVQGNVIIRQEQRTDNESKRKEHR